MTPEEYIPYAQDERPEDELEAEELEQELLVEENAFWADHYSAYGPEYDEWIANQTDI